MNLLDVVGFAGAAVVLAAFALTSTRPAAVPPRLLAGMNLGAGVLAVHGAVHHAWPSAVLNGTWFVVAVVAVCRSPRGSRGEPGPPRSPRPRPAGGPVENVSSTSPGLAAWDLHPTTQEAPCSPTAIRTAATRTTWTSRTAASPASEGSGSAGTR